jgi:hypothetical protein
VAWVTDQWNCVIPCVGDQPKVWLTYGTDIHSAADAVDFIEDGAAKGMKVNDVVIYVKTTANRRCHHARRHRGDGRRCCHHIAGRPGLTI